MQDATSLLGLANWTLWIVALVSAPILLASLAVGLVIGMVQAATSINEATLTFVPKLIVTGLVLVLLGSAMMGLIVDFTRELFSMIPGLTR